MTKTSSNESELYQVGGSLPLNSPVYVRRQADDQLYNWLKAGEFCYVLNSRQMGKSSLRVQTMQRLRSEGFSCVAIDLTQIGSKNATSDQWYAGIALNLAKGLFMSDKVDLRNWLKSRDHLSPVQRLSEFIEEVLSHKEFQQIVVFVDEIDSVLSLDFSLDDFFALIRECYNQRADKPNYRRITFALLGVSTPSELIRDKKRTPFNIGKAIELNGFQPSEVGPLAIGFSSKFENSVAIAILGKVLYWTNGQPFLTQKICKLIASSTSYDSTDVKLKWVDDLIKSKIIRNWEAQDNPEHLKTIQDRLLSNKNQAKNLLGLHKRILTLKSKVKADDSSTQEELCLSGLVAKERNYLTIQNRIYGKIFNKKWIEKELENLSLYDRLQVDWFASNSKDDSKLLTGTELRDAISKSNMRSNMSSPEWQYLLASLQHELQYYQDDLIEQKEIYEELEKNISLENKSKEVVESELNKDKEELRAAMRLISDRLSTTQFFVVCLTILSLLLSFQSLAHLQISIWEFVISAIILFILFVSSSVPTALEELGEDEEKRLDLKEEATLNINKGTVNTSEEW